MNEPYAVTADTPVDEVVDEMLKHRRGGAVIFDAQSRVIGIFTTVDALQLLLRRLRVPPSAQTLRDGD